MVSAQDQSDAAVTAAARALAVEGVKLAQADRCGEAIEKLERAEKLHHAPVVLTRLGECFIKLGRLVEGVESLRAVLREPLPTGASDAVSQAYADAKTLLEATKPKLATLTVTVQGAAASAALSLTVDGHALPAELIGAAHPRDPGEHVISVAAPGYAPATRHITLAEGQEQPVALPLVPLATRSGSAANAAGESVSPGDTTPVGRASKLPPSAARTRVNHWPAYVAWGTGAVALGVGIGFGAAALSNKSELDAHCPNKLCPPEQQRLLDTSKRNATISTIGYSVALGTAALGLVLYILESRSDERQAAKLRLEPTGVSVAF